MFLDDPPYGTGDFGTDATKLIPHAADMNGDGKLDIVLNGRKLTGTQIIPGNGDGSFQHHMDVAANIGSFGRIALGDMNNDGVRDFSGGKTVEGGSAA